MGKIQSILAGLAAVGLAVLAIFSAGRRSEKQSQTIRDLEASLETRKKSEEIENEVEGLTNRDAGDRLADWVRD